MELRAEGLELSGVKFFAKIVQENLICLFRGRSEDAVAVRGRNRIQMRWEVYTVTGGS